MLTTLTHAPFSAAMCNWRLMSGPDFQLVANAI